jgi:hypothetical protein
MSVASTFNEFDRRKLLWPHEVWPDVFEDSLRDEILSWRALSLI